VPITFPAFYAIFMWSPQKCKNRVLLFIEHIYTYIHTLADTELRWKQESFQKCIFHNIFIVIKYNGEFFKSHIAFS